MKLKDVNQPRVKAQLAANLSAAQGDCCRMIESVDGQSIEEITVIIGYLVAAQELLKGK